MDFREFELSLEIKYRFLSVCLCVCVHFSGARVHVTRCLVGIYVRSSVGTVGFEQCHLKLGMLAVTQDSLFVSAVVCHPLPARSIRVVTGNLSAVT